MPALHGTAGTVAERRDVTSHPYLHPTLPVQEHTRTHGGEAARGLLSAVDAQGGATPIGLGSNGRGFESAVQRRRPMWRDTPPCRSTGGLGPFSTGGPRPLIEEFGMPRRRAQRTGQRLGRPGGDVASAWVAPVATWPAPGTVDDAGLRVSAAPEHLRAMKVYASQQRAGENSRPLVKRFGLTTQFAGSGYSQDDRAR